MKNLKFIDDLIEYSDCSILRGFVTLLFNANFHCVLLYRLAHTLSKCAIFIPVCKLIMYLNRVLYSVDIDYRCELAGGFMLVHGIGIVVGKNVKTEGFCKVYQNVTLGGNNGMMKEIKGVLRSQPLIEEGVIIYPGSVVVGPIIVKKNSIIKANSIVNKDI